MTKYNPLDPFNELGRRHNKLDIARQDKPERVHEIDTFRKREHKPKMNRGPAVRVVEGDGCST